MWVRKNKDLSNMSEEEIKEHKRQQQRKWYKENKERVKWYYEEKKEEILKRNKIKRIENPELFMLRAAKSRAKRKNLDFNIELSDIVIPEFCPVLNIKLNTSPNNPSENSPSLDRIIPELGYVKGNVRVISHLANSMKSSASPSQLLAFATWVFSEMSKINSQQ